MIFGLALEPAARSSGTYMQGSSVDPSPRPADPRSAHATAAEAVKRIG